MVGDHFRQMKTQICIVGDVGDGFRHYQSPKLLGSSPPITQVSIFGALSISGQIHRENQRENCGDYPMGRSAKTESPHRLGFSRHMKTRLKSRPLPSPLTCVLAVVLPLRLGNDGKRTRSFPSLNLVPRAFPLPVFWGKSPGDEVAFPSRSQSPKRVT